MSDSEEDEYGSDNEMIDYEKFAGEEADKIDVYDKEDFKHGLIDAFDATALTDEDVIPPEDGIETYKDEVLSDESLLKKDTSHEEIRIPDDERRTSDYMDIMDCANKLAIRASDIAKTGKSLAMKTDGFTDPLQFARQEMIEGCFPGYVKRYVGHGMCYYELWDINELTKPASLLQG